MNSGKLEYFLVQILVVPLLYSSHFPNSSIFRQVCISASRSNDVSAIAVHFSTPAYEGVCKQLCLIENLEYTPLLEFYLNSRCRHEFRGSVVLIHWTLPPPIMQIAMFSLMSQKYSHMSLNDEFWLCTQDISSR